MSLINGVVIGLITEINEKGMVKVKFPWLPDEPETDWIRIATAMSGDDRGTFFMPEPQDECLVAFEHGDTSYPYVVGFMWNGKDKPPETDKNTRKIKTTSGHVIEFDDNQGQEKITIESQGGHQVTLDDPGKKISIKSNGENQVTLEDPTKISIRSSVGQSIEIDDTATGMITISTSTGSIDISTGTGNIGISTSTGNIGISTTAGNVIIDCLSATVTAKSSLTIAAPMTIFSGVVQIPTLIGGVAQFNAVVTQAINPGIPLNILGL